MFIAGTTTAPPRVTVKNSPARIGSASTVSSQKKKAVVSVTLLVQARGTTLAGSSTGSSARLAQPGVKPIAARRSPPKHPQRDCIDPKECISHATPHRALSGNHTAEGAPGASWRTALQNLQARSQRTDPLLEDLGIDRGERRRALRFFGERFGALPGSLGA
jgi:uncharacterized protein YjiS (DUF1127 family)